MGRTVHTAIIITASYSGFEGFRAAWEFARGLRVFNAKAECDDSLLITDALDGFNGWSSFAVLPDGSNVGRARHENCCTMRDQLIEHLQRTPSIQWVEVAFGEDGEGAYITRERA